jgi:hypothetical protein
VSLVVVAAAAVTLPTSLASPPSARTGSGAAYGLTKNFQLVGHNDIGKRGMNSPIAVAGRCVYVGDRTYDQPRANGGVAIIDAINPASPKQVGLIAPVALSTQREMRADAALGILAVESYSPYIDGALSDPGGASVNNLKLYDIHGDCRKPKLLGTYDFGPRAPHEFFLWKDPKHPGRALAYVTFTIYSPDLLVIDLTNPATPALVGAYDLGVDQAKKAVDFVDESGSGYMHSVSVSDDGTRAFVSGWDYGFYELDTSMLANPRVGHVGLARPASIGTVDYGADVHSAAKVPGRPYVVLGQEDYANAGHGCPFGLMRVADITNPAKPKVAGVFATADNGRQSCGKKNGTFSAHNQTVFPHVALMSWYAGGLRAIDIAKPPAVFEDGVFVPKPAFTPTVRDERLFFPAKCPTGPIDPNRPLPTDTKVGCSSAPRWTGAMWSYPVVQRGLIYVVDIDLGLYILRYAGPHSDEVARASFVEGNSSPSAYGSTAAVATRTAAQWRSISAAVAHGPATVQSPYRTADIHALADHGFICL